MDGLPLSIRTAIEALSASGWTDMTLMAIGGLLLAFSALKIIRSSLVLIVWVALAGLGFGIGSMGYGMDRSEVGLPLLRERGGDWIDRIGDEAGTRAEALVRVCRQFIER